MKLLHLPSDTKRRRLTFFLAMEEWAARTLPAEEYFFVWEVGPTVICGRNQEVDKEVNIDFCRIAGIDICRRRSGGGAVLADSGNFMFSYIAPGEDTECIFRNFTDRVTAMLRSLGLDAEARGRNDIYIGPRKVSGGAYYRLPGRGIAHCTMLYSFDPMLMSLALTPGRGKLESKGVTSADVTVTSLSAEGLILSPAEFKAFILENIADEHLKLSSTDIEAIEKIQRRYDDSAFIFGKKIVARPGLPVHSLSTYLINAGTMELTMALSTDGSTIAGCHISGDFFSCNEGVVAIEKIIEGSPADIDALSVRLAEIDVGMYIRGLTTSQLLNLARQLLRLFK